MKVVILAGGLGTRLAEETEIKPKPMVEIGGRPILWHIMRGYSHFGYDEFVIALGYKGELIKRYFWEYHRFHGSLTLNMGDGGLSVHANECEKWVLHLMDTGQDTMTGGRVKRLAPLLKDRFMLTYGDGVCSVDIRKLLEFHSAKGKLMTVTAVRPPSRFGGIALDGDAVVEFTEKPQIGEGWINGGFMVCEPAVLDFISGDGSSLEAEAMEELARQRQLAAYRHEGFWQCMDTLRDVRLLQSQWQSGQPQWRVWD